MLMGGKCSLLCLHGASLTDRLVGGVWHPCSSGVYLTKCLPCRMAPPYTGLSTGSPALRQGQEGRGGGRLGSPLWRSRGGGVRETLKGVKDHRTREEEQRMLLLLHPDPFRAGIWGVSGVFRYSTPAIHVLIQM